MKLEGFFSEILDRDFDSIKNVLSASGFFEQLDLKKGHAFESYLINKNKGIELVFNRDLSLEAIHLFSDGIQEYKEFKHLPLDLKFTMGTEQIATIFSNVEKNVGGNQKTPLGWMNLWENYILDNSEIKINYSKDGQSIEFITISSGKG